MKTLTREQLLALPFTITKTAIVDKNLEQADDEYSFDPFLEDEERPFIPTETFRYWIVGTVEAQADGIVLSAGWQANGYGGTLHEAYQFRVELDDILPEITGAVLVDDEGDRLLGWEIGDAIETALNNAGWRDAVCNVLPDFDEEQETETIDCEDTTMETFTLQRDNAADLRFNGELVASVASSWDQASGSYSGVTGRRAILRLYKTAGGKFVCHKIGQSQWQGEKTRYSAAVCATEAEVREFFGQNWLAKELYEEAGIENIEDVE